MIADIDANVGQISGDFGEEIRLLKSFKGSIGLETLSYREAAGMHNLNPRRVIRLR